MIYVKGYTPLPAMALPLLFLVSSALHAQSTPHFVVSADTVLLDEPIRLGLSGLQPRQDVTIKVEGNRGVWHSSGIFRSDENGRVDVADPMKLIWSATGDPRQGAPAAMGALQPWVFRAEANGQVVAEDTVWRRGVAGDVRIVRVREHGLVGTAYFPPGSGPHPAMLVVSGSQGGIPAPAAYAGGLASHGYAVLALAYFNAEGLPPLLANIPLEYFVAGVKWLKSQPGVDSTRIGMMGGSRGGELALLLASTFPELFRAVVASVPSNVVWPGLSDESEAAAWTLNGKPLPSMRADNQASDLSIAGVDRFRRRLRTQLAMQQAEIPVERIKAPVLLFSGKDDQIWPSALFATRVVERLEQHHFTYPVEHYSYENAGHMIGRPYVPTTNVQVRQIHPVSHRWNIAGGTPEGQARANEDSWQRLLTFLQTYLRP